METKICEKCWKIYWKPKFRITHKERECRKYCSRECRHLIQRWRKKTDEQKRNMNMSWLSKWHWWNRWMIYTEEQKSKQNINWLLEQHKKQRKWWITKENKKERNKIEYRLWRLAVYERDWFTCQMPWCGMKWDIASHHIKKYSKHPELRYVLSNWITLCKHCHRKTIWNEEKYEELFNSIINIIWA